MPDGMELTEAEYARIREERDRKKAADKVASDAATAREAARQIRADVLTMKLGRFNGLCEVGLLGDEALEILLAELFGSAADARDFRGRLGAYAAIEAFLKRHDARRQAERHAGLDEIRRHPQGT